MTDLQQQPDSVTDQPEKQSMVRIIASDNYTLLLAIGVLLLLISLAALAFVHLTRYGLGSKPVLGSAITVLPVRSEAPDKPKSQELSW